MYLVAIDQTCGIRVLKVVSSVFTHSLFALLISHDLHRVRVMVDVIALGLRNALQPTIAG